MLFVLCYAGLYKQLTTLRDLLNDVRADPNSVSSLKLPIASNVDACGLQVNGAFCCLGLKQAVLFRGPRLLCSTAVHHHSLLQ